MKKLSRFILKEVRTHVIVGSCGGGNVLPESVGRGWSEICSDSYFATEMGHRQELPRKKTLMVSQASVSPYCARAAKSEL